MVRREIDNRIRTLIESGIKQGHRSMFVVVGDKAQDQVENLFIWGIPPAPLEVFHYLIIATFLALFHPYALSTIDHTSTDAAMKLLTKPVCNSLFRYIHLRK